jgi:hypothetical protein
MRLFIAQFIFEAWSVCDIKQLALNVSAATMCVHGKLVDSTIYGEDLKEDAGSTLHEFAR